MALCYSCSDCGRCKYIYNKIIKCPKCGSSNLKDKEICKKYGAVLEPNKDANQSQPETDKAAHSNG